MISEKTVGIIYSVKQCPYNDVVESVAQFMMRYSGSPREVYTDYMVKQLVEQAFAEILDYVEHPSAIMREYFH